jgi:hypothetical protein
VAESEPLVIDASVVVDLVARTPRASAVGARLRGSVWHAPAYLDADVLSALGRLERASKLNVGEAADSLCCFRSYPSNDIRRRFFCSARGLYVMWCASSTVCTWNWPDSYAFD